MSEGSYTIAPARYAKGMMAIHVRSAGSGWKTRAHRLAGYFARERYSGREGAYILSRAAAAKFEEHFKAGYDGGFIERKLTPPSHARTIETGSTR